MCIRDRRRIPGKHPALGQVTGRSVVEKTEGVGIAYWNFIAHGIEVPACLTVEGLKGNPSERTVSGQDISRHSLECVTRPRSQAIEIAIIDSSILRDVIPIQWYQPLTRRWGPTGRGRNSDFCNCRERIVCKIQVDPFLEVGCQ